MGRVSARNLRAESPIGGAEKDGTPGQPDPREPERSFGVFEGYTQNIKKIPPALGFHLNEGMVTFAVHNQFYR